MPFEDVEDVSDYFSKNPWRLVNYVRSTLPQGAYSGHAILSVHLLELARMLNVYPIIGGEERRKMTVRFVSRNEIQNLDILLGTAELMFRQRY